MSLIKIALLQMTSLGNDQVANLAKGETYCQRASDLGADIALFPEMWNIGYNFYNPAEPKARETWEESAISQDGDFVTHFKVLAKELKMAIALTNLERWNGAPRNSVSLIDLRGRIEMTYAKVHTCDFDKEAALTPGDDFHVCNLVTKDSEEIIGAMICFDCEFPESARVLMLKGGRTHLNAQRLHLGRTPHGAI